MALILTRSPYFVSRNDNGDEAILTLEIGAIEDTTVILKSYSLVFGTQTDIDVSPLIADFYSKEVQVLFVQTTVSGDTSTLLDDHIATDGYGYYEDGFNLDLTMGFRHPLHARLYTKPLYHLCAT